MTGATGLLSAACGTSSLLSFTILTILLTFFLTTIARCLLLNLH